MSIENTLERIANGIEQLIALQKGGQAATAPATTAPPVAAASPATTAPPVGGPPPVAGPGAAPGGPPVGGPPPAGGPPVGGPPPAGGAAPPPSAVGIADQIREAANAFHRAQPGRGGEVWAILASVGAQKIDDIPLAYQAQVLQQIQALGG